MNVEDIILRIAEISLDEDLPDLETKGRILNFVNLVHDEIHERTAELNSAELSTTQTLAIVSGTGTMSPVPYKILSVYDETNKKMLPLTTIEDLEAKDNELSTTGSPSEYYILGNDMNTYPMSNQSLRVRYVPDKVDFTLSTLAADIPLPAVFHSIYIHGGLVYLYTDEKDFRSSIEIREAKDNYKASLTHLVQYLSNNRKPSKSNYMDF